MSEFNAVPGDGVSTIPICECEEGDMPTPAECTTCPIDLPPNVAAQLQLESVGNVQQTNNNARGIANIASGVLQAAAARNFDELGAVESRATSGVMATPIASPTTQ